MLETREKYGNERSALYAPNFARRYNFTGQNLLSAIFLWNFSTECSFTKYVNIERTRRFSNHWLQRYPITVFNVMKIASKVEKNYIWESA